MKTTLHECLKDLPSDFVTQRLGGDDCDFLADPLIGMEIHGETSVVLLNNDLGGLLDSLCPDATLESYIEKTNQISHPPNIVYNPLHSSPSINLNIFRPAFSRLR